MSRAISEYVERASSVAFLPWNDLSGKTVLITGGTGLVGSAVVRILLRRGVRTVIMSRDRNKAKRMFPDAVAIESVDEADRADYIIHSACPTGSAYFVSNPVELIDTVYSSAKSLLEYSKTKKIKSFVFCSSCEVYGAPNDGKELFENSPTDIGTSNPRSSYGESKRIAEMLSASYAHEYSVNAMSIRLGPVLGPGTTEDDNRIRAVILRCMRDGKDIELSSDGATVQSYIHTFDAATAILTVLLKGTSGEAYNAANPDATVSILSLAKKAAAMQGKIRVRVNCHTENRNIFNPTCVLRLNADKLMSLGWSPMYGIDEMLSP